MTLHTSTDGPFVLKFHSWLVGKGGGEGDFSCVVDLRNLSESRQISSSVDLYHVTPYRTHLPSIQGLVVSVLYYHAYITFHSTVKRTLAQL